LLANEPELIEQANEALVEHVRKNNKKWVNLMQWMGADPRAEISGKFGDEITTALKEAALYGRLELLKHFKLNPKRDDLFELAVAAISRVWSPEPSTYKDKYETLEYILSFGPDLNQPTSSGELIMDIHFKSFDGFRLDVILCLVKHGAQWDGGISGESWFRLRDFRRCLRKLHPQDQIEVLRALSENGAITQTALKTLISTDTMRELVKSHPYETRAIRDYAGIRSRLPRRV
jgi:hypothetical protein